jgi:hypothetical protein
MTLHEPIRFEDNIYLVQRIKFENDSVKDNIDLLCECYNADKVLRKDGRLYFLKRIEDAEVIAWLPKQ